jgi:glyoxylase-like metal-dependent hydrolase (beta-lactamase superfamily II)
MSVGKSRSGSTPEQEIGPQLRALGVGPRDVKRVVLTHLHMDHDGGLAHFPTAKSWWRRVN